MTFAWRAKSEETPSTSLVTMTEPSGASSGDLLIAVWQYRGTGDMVAPDGWTLAFADDGGDANAGGNSNQRVWFQQRSGSAPNLTWTASGSVDVRCASMFAYSGSVGVPSCTATSTVIDASTNARFNCGPVVTTQANQLLFVVGVSSGSFGAEPADADVGPTTASGAVEVTSALSSTTWRCRMVGTTTVGADAGVSACDALMASPGTVTVSGLGNTVPTHMAVLVFAETSTRSFSVIIG